MMGIRDEWQTEDGSIRLLLGDCLEILPGLGKVDACVTDPPYGIGAAKMNLGYSAASRLEKLDWDSEKPDLAPLLSLGVQTIVWGGNYFRLPPSRCFLIWDKGPSFRNRSFAECEQAWCSFDASSRIFSMCPLSSGSYDGKQHPTQKPVALMEWCLGFLPNAETILDPFMGSGTTGLACIRLGRRFVGIEKEPKYFEIAKKRIRDELAKTALIEKPKRLVQTSFVEVAN